MRVFVRKQKLTLKCKLCTQTPPSAPFKTGRAGASLHRLPLMILMETNIAMFQVS